MAKVFLSTECTFPIYKTYHSKKVHPSLWKHAMGDDYHYPATSLLPKALPVMTKRQLTAEQLELWLVGRIEDWSHLSLTSNETMENKKTRWWFQPIWKNLSNWILSPSISRGENNKYLKPPPRTILITKWNTSFLLRKKYQPAMPLEELENRREKGRNNCMEVEPSIKLCLVLHLSHEKNHPTFHYTGWLIGILIMVYFDPYITG